MPTPLSWNPRPHSPLCWLWGGRFPGVSLKPRAVTAEVTKALTVTWTPKAGRRRESSCPGHETPVPSPPSPQELPRRYSQGHPAGLTRAHVETMASRGPWAPARSRYLGPEPELAGQAVVPDLLGELDAEVPGGAVLGDAHVHDLVNDVQHVVLEEKGRCAGLWPRGLVLQKPTTRLTRWPFQAGRTAATASPSTPRGPVRRRAPASPLPPAAVHGALCFLRSLDGSGEPVTV